MILKKDFPILFQQVHGHDLVYLDSAATTQKPASVISAISNYYKTYNSNVHRGLHHLSNQATKAYEEGRDVLGRWINAKHLGEEIIFTKGATEGLNLAASCISDNLNEGDVVLVSALEHHANLIPWQQVAKTKGVILKQIPINDVGELDLLEYQKLLNEGCKVVAVNAMSNTLGTINPVKMMSKAAHDVGAILVCDATQMAPHFRVDVVDLDCDVLVMSGHKMYAPTGIGMCYAKKSLQSNWPPYQTGGEMIDVVEFDSATFKPAPFRFEAGTPNIAGVIGWVAAIEYMEPRIKEIISHERKLISILDDGLDQIPGLCRYSRARDKAAIASFVIDGCHPQDIAIMLDTFGIAVRSGHHCTMPLLKILKVSGLVRVSVAAYNEVVDIERLLTALPKVQRMCEA